MFTLITSEMF